MEKNGEVVQRGDSSLMLNGIDPLIEEISQVFTVKIGDLIFTGTPAGVGPVKSGDVLEGYLFEKKMFTLKVR